MRSDINLTVIGSSDVVNTTIAKILPKYCNSVFVMNKQDLYNNSKECVNIIEQSEAIILDVSILNKSKHIVCNYKKEDNTKIPVIILDTYTEPVYAKSVIENGASAYLPINAFSEEIEDVLKAVLNNGKYISKLIEQN